MRKPNILFILADDLSYRDVGCYGQKYIRTPNIDAIAASGMKFTDFYAAAPICAPSRCGLLTGRHMGHARIREHGQPIANGSYQESLHEGDYTIGDVLSGAGYATAAIGKWAVGVEGTKAIPNYKGFDYSFGFYDQNYAHTFYPEYVWENGRRYDLPSNRGFDMSKRYRYNYSRYDRVTPDDNEYGENGDLILRELADPSKAQNTYDLCEQKALDFIRRSADRPFFLYFAVQNPHGPLIVPSLEPYTHAAFPSQRHKEWAAIITRLDTGVGRMTALLRELGIYDDTLIIFASDNGYSAWGYFGLKMTEEVPFFEHKGGFRGSKFTLDGEGGLRVPFTACWSGHIPQGCVSHRPTAFWDVLPTLAEAAGTDIPSDTDGISFLPTLTGKAGQCEHEYLYWEQNHMQAVRFGGCKVFRPSPALPCEVYDLINDISESHDLADTSPQLIRRAEEVFSEARFDSDVYLNPEETDEAHRKRLLAMDLRCNCYTPDNPEREKWIASFE